MVLSVVVRIIEHVFRSYQYVLHPTARQGRALEHLLAVQCEAYNAALEERREAFKRGIRVHRFDQFAQLKDLHETRPDFMQYGVTVARGTLTRLDRAFCAFYRRVAAGQVGLLITKITERAPFDGYTDHDATEKKLVRNGFRRGDCWFNTGDLVRDQGWSHVAFVDRLGDTFRWKGENVATTEVEAALSEWPAVEQAVVYGVEVPGVEGRAGMAALKLRADLDGKALAGHLVKRLPGYAIPLFLRVIDEVEQTSTFKSRKVELRDEGYAGGGPVYVLADREAGYVPAYDGYAAEVAAGRIRV